MTRTVKHVCPRLRRVPFKITFQFHDDLNEETPLTLSTSLLLDSWSWPFSTLDPEDLRQVIDAVKCQSKPLNAIRQLTLLESVHRPFADRQLVPQHFPNAIVTWRERSFSNKRVDLRRMSELTYWSASARHGNPAWSCSNVKYLRREEHSSDECQHRLTCASRTVDCVSWSFSGVRRRDTAGRGNRAQRSTSNLCRTERVQSRRGVHSKPTMFFPLRSFWIVTYRLRNFFRLPRVAKSIFLRMCGHTAITLGNQVIWLPLKSPDESKWRISILSLTCSVSFRSLACPVSWVSSDDGLSTDWIWSEVRREGKRKRKKSPALFLIREIVANCASVRSVFRERTKKPKTLWILLVSRSIGVSFGPRTSHLSCAENDKWNEQMWSTRTNKTTRGQPGDSSLVLQLNLSPPPFAIFNETLADSSMMIGVTLSLVTLLTALANIFVLLPFYPENNLQTINARCVPSSDHFSVNMPIADFLVVETNQMKRKARNMILSKTKDDRPFVQEIAVENEKQHLACRWSLLHAQFESLGETLEFDLPLQR